MPRTTEEIMQHHCRLIAEQSARSAARDAKAQAYADAPALRRIIERTKRPRRHFGEGYIAGLNAFAWLGSPDFHKCSAAEALQEVRRYRARMAFDGRPVHPGQIAKRLRGAALNRECAAERLSAPLSETEAVPAQAAE